MKTKKILLYTLILLTAIAVGAVFVLSQKSRPTPFEVAGIPTVSPGPSASIKPAEAALARPVMADLGWSIKGLSIRTAELQSGEVVPFLQMLAVSEGVFITQTIEGFTLDLVMALLPSKAGVIEVPVPVGFSNDREYFSLDTSAEPGPVERANYLLDLSEKLARGKIFLLSTLNANFHGVDRQPCQYGLKDWCELARRYNQNFGGTEGMFISKTLSSSSWLPIGWYIAFSTDPAYSGEVSLP